MGNVARIQGFYTLAINLCKKTQTRNPGFDTEPRESRPRVEGSEHVLLALPSHSREEVPH